jgi:hypothetical protein
MRLRRPSRAKINSKKMAKKVSRPRRKKNFKRRVGCRMNTMKKAAMRMVAVMMTTLRSKIFHTSPKSRSAKAKMKARTKIGRKLRVVALSSKFLLESSQLTKLK